MILQHGNLSPDAEFLGLVSRVKEEGTMGTNRTVVNATRSFGHFLEFNLLEHFPLLTTKRVFHRAFMEELFWFFNGSHNINSLVNKDVHIWDEWADTNGDLGPVYGTQWRFRPDVHRVAKSDPLLQSKIAYFKQADIIALETGSSPFEVEETEHAYYFRRTIDQLGTALYRLRKYPDCRRIIVDGWNPGVIPLDGVAPKDQVQYGLQALPACHTLFQFGSTLMKPDEELYRSNLQMFDFQTPINENPRETVRLWGDDTGEHIIRKDDTNQHQAIAQRMDSMLGPMRNRRYLDLHLHQRSCDSFLGGPFNVASYAAAAGFVGATLGMIPRKLTISFGDFHIYENHMQQFETQLQQPIQQSPKFAMFNMNEHRDLKNLTASNYAILDYRHGPHLPGQVAV